MTDTNTLALNKRLEGAPTTREAAGGARGVVSRVVSDASQDATRALLEDAFARFGTDRIAISFSGAEDVVLIDMASSILGRDIPVFTLDTGRLHPETYRFIETVRERYGVDMEVRLPNATSVEQLVRKKGLFSFYRDGHQQCCAVRKIQPLREKLAGLDAWITGQRRDQGVTRTQLPAEQVDTVFSTPGRTLVKFNPLAEWTAADVWSYIHEHDVPYNPLHDQGMPSIGCEPCTRAIGPNQSERDGRWWWENADDKECGLHAQNVKPIKFVS